MKSEVKVGIPQCQQDRSEHAAGCSALGRKGWFTLVAGGIAVVAFPAVAGSAQQAAPVTPRPIVIPNRSLDSHELSELAEKNSRKRNFDAANAERKRVIDEDISKLLILARDLKAKTDNLGSSPLTPTMIREAEVIEMLASDVKEKMKLTMTAD